MEELEVGDWLWFPNMGAYSRATASEFNGFPTPPVFVANDLPATESTIKENSEAVSSGIKYMQPVSARSFWSE
jgi:hypothetical protein